MFNLHIHRNKKNEEKGSAPKTKPQKTVRKITPKKRISPKPEMTKTEIQNILKSAIETLKHTDTYVIDTDAHEQSITGKIAC